MNVWSDMQLATLTPELGGYFGTDKGLLVLRGPGKDSLKLRDGDVILDIGGRAPTSPEHALRILGSFEPGEKLTITVMRKQRRETLTVDIPGDSPG
jgi:S1-C subfamily serine protease